MPAVLALDDEQPGWADALIDIVESAAPPPRPKREPLKQQPTFAQQLQTLPGR